MLYGPAVTDAERQAVNVIGKTRMHLEMTSALEAKMLSLVVSPGVHENAHSQSIHHTVMS